MEVYDHSSSHNKRKIYNRNVTLESNRMKEGEKLDDFKGRKHRSNRTHKHSSQLDIEELNNGNKKRNGGHDKFRKRSSITGSGDEVDNDLMSKSRYKILRKSIDDKKEHRTSEYHHRSSRKSCSKSSYDRDVKKAGENERRYSYKDGGRENDIKKSYDNGKNNLYLIDDKMIVVEKKHGPNGGRFPRGSGRTQINRDSQPKAPLNMIGSPFGPIQSIGPNMNFLIGPPSVFMPQFSGPLGWPGPCVPPNVHPPLPVPVEQWFMPNIGDLPNHPMYFNQQGLGRRICPSSLPGPAFNPAGSIDRGMSNEFPASKLNQTRNSLPPGTTPSRGDQNDYSQNFVDTGRRPQNFIRELGLTSVVEDYPKIKELIQRKDEIVKNATTPPMYHKCDLKEHLLSPELFGTKFDVILVDPPWEEYAHRAPGVAGHLDYWTFEDILNLKIEAIADTPSFIFLWVGDGVGLEQGRRCLKKWGFRRCEDICWVKTNKNIKTPSLRHDSNTMLQYSKEHCLMGIKGTVRRGVDGHIIHANIDTDIIVSEEPPYGSSRKPDDMYRIIEHFALGKRRLELFGEDHNIRSGWLTVGKGLSSSNFNAERYICNFADKDGKVWQGGGGRNPPPEAPHLLRTTPEIENLRPKSPPPKTQQPMPPVSNANLSSMSPNQANWGSSPIISGNCGNNFYDAFGFNSNLGQVAGDSIQTNPSLMFTMNMI